MLYIDVMWFHGNLGVSLTDSSDWSNYQNLWTLLEEIIKKYFPEKLIEY